MNAAPTVALVLGALVALPASGQERELTPLGIWDVSVDSVVAVLRSGPFAAQGHAGKVRSHIAAEPESWPRARVDSLAAGVTQVLLEDRYVNMTSTLVGLLVLEAPDGARVGTPYQLIRLANAGRELDNLRRSSVIRNMARLGEEPVIVDFLASVATSTGERDSQLERELAVRALTTSDSGRARLRQMWSEGSVQDRATRILMEGLEKRGFLPDFVPLGVWDISVDSIIELLRGGPDAATAVSMKVQSDLTRDPERWPRTRLDSLAAGVERVLLEDRYVGETSILVSMLVHEAPDGALVGTPEQLIRLADEGLARENLQRPSVIRKMAVVSGDPTIVAFLASVATSEDTRETQLGREVAVRVLTTSPRGRARLREMWAERSVRDRATLLLLEALSRRDFAESLRGG